MKGMGEKDFLSGLCGCDERIFFFLSFVLRRGQYFSFLIFILWLLKVKFS